MSIVTKLKQEIEVINAKLASIQSECSHPELAVTYRNFSDGAERPHTKYWADFHCSLCDKQWTGAQRSHKGSER